MLLILAVFAGSHSGLAYLRPYGELLRQQLPDACAIYRCMLARFAVSLFQIAVLVPSNRSVIQLDCLCYSPLT